MLVTENVCLICSNWTKVRRSTKNKNNKDKILEDMFVDSVLVICFNGEASPLIETRKEVKIDDTPKEYQNLITQAWQVTEAKWQSN